MPLCPLVDGPEHTEVRLEVVGHGGEEVEQVQWAVEDQAAPRLHKVVEDQQALVRGEGAAAHRRRSQ